MFNQATFNKPHQNFDDMQNFNSTKMAKYLKKVPYFPNTESNIA